MLIIPDQEKLNKTISNIAAAGPGSLHILSDFDRTFTKAFVDGQKSPTVIAQIRNGNFLTPDYAPRAHAYYDYYHPIEIDPKIPREQKEKEMQDWWEKHFDLLIECGLNLKVMQEIVAQKTLRFRPGALELIDILHQNNIPLIFMSAGPGDMIKMYLEQEGRLYDNVKIVANFLKFDDVGMAVGVKEPIIHSLNKYEIILKDFPAYAEVKNRKNVILLGDGPDDIGMITGFEYDNLIKIGFLNENIAEQEAQFKKDFDVIITDDGDMAEVQKIMEKIVK